MKKILFSVLFCLLCFGIQAQENLLQILPTAVAIDDRTKVLEISMNNTDPYLALQFNIYLPQGISLKSGTKPFGTLPKDRFPYTESYDELEDVTTTTFSHIVQFATHEGYTTFVISPNDLSYIKGNSGTILKLYVVTETTMSPGLYPVKFDNVVFTKYENEKMISVNAPAVSTFLIVGSPQIGTKVDLSSLTGYIPNDVCTATNTWLADKSDVTEVDLSNADDVGNAVEAPNPNTLFYMKAGSSFAEKQSAAKSANVVKGSACEKFVLNDGYPTNISKSFTAASVSYKRTLPAAGWYSLCLPFAGEIPSGVSAEKFSSLDVAANKVIFSSVSALEANIPYIFNASSNDVEFTAADAAIYSNPESPTDHCFVGTYKKINAVDIQGCYALRADGTGFGTTTATAYVDPFRAYIKKTSGAKEFSIVHDKVTSVKDIVKGGLDVQSGDGYVTLSAAGENQEVNILSADGKLVTRFIVMSGALKQISLPAGFYLINQIKIFVK